MSILQSVKTFNRDGVFDDYTGPNPGEGPVEPKPEILKAWSVKGVRVDGDNVVIATKGNEEARRVCGELLALKPGGGYPLYKIITGIPSRGMNGFSFKIILHPRWKEVVASSRIPSPESMGSWHKYVGSNLLDSFGFSNHIYPSESSIRLSFGAWGLEHITVPGNGCGLDITDRISIDEGGSFLESHNVDSYRQAGLIQYIFHWWANHWLTEWSLTPPKF